MSLATFRFRSVISKFSLCLSAMAFLLSCAEPVKEEAPVNKEQELVKVIEEATGQDAWRAANWITWSFAGVREYVWKQKEQLIQMRFDTILVQFEYDSLERSRVYHNGVLKQDSAAKALVKTAWSAFNNDSFWLNAPGMLNAPGTELTRKDTLQVRRLQVNYTSGGSTPGDKYIWHIDSTGLPIYYEMRLKASNYQPIPASWEDWKDVGNGAMVSTKHIINGRELPILNVAIGESTQDIGLNGDPFQGL